MARDLPHPDIKNTPIAREGRNSVEKFKKRLAITLSAILIGMVVNFAKDEKTDQFVEDLPFLVGAIHYQIDSLTSFEDEPYQVVLVEEGEEFQYTTGWSESEIVVLTHQIEKAREFLDEIFGPPMPWTDNQVILVLDGENNARLNNYQTLAGYSHLGGVFTRVRILLLIHPEYKTDIRVIVHELRHANNDDLHVPWPMAWTEGQAEFAGNLYVREHPEEHHTDRGVIPAFSPADYDRYNVPALAEMKFFEAKFEHQQLFYMMAAEAWNRWYTLHPDFFKRMNVRIAEFYDEHGMKPSHQVVLMIATEEFDDFGEFLDNNHVLRNESRHVDRNIPTSQ